MRKKTIIPSAAINDARLNGSDFRVLTALCYFGQDDTPFVPLRQNLSLIAGLPETSISRAVTKLCDCGWVVRISQGGKGHPSRYKINWDLSPLSLLDGDVQGSSGVTLNPSQGSNGDTLKAAQGNAGDTQSVKQGGSGDTLIGDLLPQSVNRDTLNPSQGSTGDTQSVKQGGSGDTLIGDLLPQSVNRDTLNPSQGSTGDTLDHDHDDLIDDHQIDLEGVYNILTSHRVKGFATSERARKLIQSWVDAGVTSVFLTECINYAFDHCKEGSPGVPYIHRVIESKRDGGAEQANRISIPDKSDEKACVALGSKIGCPPKAGEGMFEFYQRLVAKVRQLNAERRQAA